MESIKNWGKVTVSTGYNSSATAITLQAGDGAKLPDIASGEANFRLVWWNFTDFPDPADDPNAEIVVVTDNTSDVLTVVRPSGGNSYNGEGSSNTAHTHNTALKTYKMALVLTKKIMADIETLISNAPQGQLLNGKFVTSVASNNLTVALKTLAGNDPSLTDPVYIRIGNTVRRITAALSVTKNAGTNWFNAGSAELATQEIDYFIYMGYNATDGVTIGFARIPDVTTYNGFNLTTTHRKYGAISNVSNAVSTDEYELVGRFNAVLSAGASYNWSIPATSIVISRPTYESRVLTWAPQYSGSASMTFTSVTTNVAHYKIKKNYAHIDIEGVGTSGGTPDNHLIFSLPFDLVAALAYSPCMACVINDGISQKNGILVVVSSTALGIRKYDATNYANGGGKYIAASGDYEI